MKPLTNTEEFTKRFGNFIDGEIRSIEIISPTTMRITLAGQDSARSFDWITVTLEFNGVSDARLLDQSKLSLIDMSEGLTIINDNKFAFAIGECYNISSIKSSTLYIECNGLKYEEGAF